MPLSRIRSGRWLCRTSMVSPSRKETTEPVKSDANTVEKVEMKKPNVDTEPDCDDQEQKKHPVGGCPTGRPSRSSALHGCGGSDCRTMRQTESSAKQSGDDGEINLVLDLTCCLVQNILSERQGQLEVIETSSHLLSWHSCALRVPDRLFSGPLCVHRCIRKVVELASRTYLLT